LSSQLESEGAAGDQGHLCSALSYSISALSTCDMSKPAKADAI